MHMVAARALSAGEPVLLSYGNLQNDFLLMDYGFVIPGNPFETVQLRFGPELVEVGWAACWRSARLLPSERGSTAGSPLHARANCPPSPLHPPRLPLAGRQGGGGHGKR